MSRKTIEGVSRERACRLAERASRETVKAVHKAVLQRWGGRIFMTGMVVGGCLAALAYAWLTYLLK